MNLNTPNYEISEAYAGLRNLVFQLSSDRPGSGTPCELTAVAVMMEFTRPKAVVTLVAVADGTASLYFSSGGGVIGSGESESVRTVALDFIDVAARTGEAMTQAISYPLPQQGFVRFYIIASNNVSTVEVFEDSLRADADDLSRLFRKGHELISVIRQHNKQEPPT